MMDAALKGLRVVELADDRGAYCGKLLADMGADVVKVERPGGDPTRMFAPFWGEKPDPGRSLPFLYQNTSKRSIELDLEREEGRALFSDLCARSDLLIETLPPGALDDLGVGYRALSERNPALVVTSITGFGQTGPYAHYASTDLIASAMGGSMYVIGHAEDPPVRHASAQTHMSASACAAASSMIALHHAGRTGQGQQIDISAQEISVSVSHIAGVSKWLEDGHIPKRFGSGLIASIPSGAYPCSDGQVYLACNRPGHWDALAQWIHEVTGNEEVIDPMFQGPSSKRLPFRELLDLFIGELTQRFTIQEVYHEGQRRHIAFTPANTATSLAADEHLAERHFFVDIDHGSAGTLRYPGAPFRHPTTPWRISHPAPAPGEHTAEVLAELRDETPTRTKPDAPGPPPERPLEGLRIVEFGAGMAGPWVGRFMAWCGAEVVKVESRGFPDVTRLYIPPWAPDQGISAQLSPWFTDWNAGKRFVSVDLHKPEAVKLVHQLVAKSDVLVENYSTGVLDKLGVGYEALREVNPELVMLSSNGYGDSGPNRSYVTWGNNIEALSGLGTLTGFPERECTISHYAYPDPVSGIQGLFAVLCALRHRDAGGSGQHITLAQLETMAAGIGPLLLEYFANGKEPERIGNRSRNRAPHGCYPCQGEDRWCCIAVTGDEEWRRFCEVLEEPAWLEDPRFATLEQRLANTDALDALIAAWTSPREDYEVMHTLQRAGVAAGVVQHAEDQFERDPHLAERGFFERIHHLVKGEVRAAGIPLGLMGTPGHTNQAGEAIGQDNEYVFREVLGVSDADYAALVSIGAIEPMDS
jgi:crotonobetainyl-CoA:carnitine CoA-transferase CaiB-like acyl-CoA transferase